MPPAFGKKAKGGERNYLFFSPSILKLKNLFIWKNIILKTGAVNSGEDFFLIPARAGMTSFLILN
jgi:hypothetical protein